MTVNNKGSYNKKFRLYNSNIEKKRYRRYLGSYNRKMEMEIPKLVSIQLDSYEKFLQKNVDHEKREKIGLHKEFISKFPFYNYSKNVKLDYIKYRLTDPYFSVSECLKRGLTYSSSLMATLKLVIFHKNNEESKKKIKCIREQEVYMGEIPLITQNGSFVINGNERVVVSQLHRSPGVFFEDDKGKSHSSRKILYSARIIPYRGSWIDFEFDSKDYLYVRIDKKRKLPATIFLRAMGFETEEILESFFNKIEISLKNDYVEIDFLFFKKEIKKNVIPFDISIPKLNINIKKNTKVRYDVIKKIEKNNIKKIRVNFSSLNGQKLLKPIISRNTGEILFDTNSEINRQLIKKSMEEGINKIEVIYVNEYINGPYILNTMSIDHTVDKDEAVVEIYRMIRPGEPPTKESAKILFKNLFFDSERYDLSDIGRMKFNYRFKENEKSTLISKNDVVNVIKSLINIKDGKEYIDDIDHLGNRRVRSVGELVLNQFHIGLERIERSIRERLGLAEQDNLMPQDLINTKQASSAIKDFFSTSQLSQFMDQNNPLSEIIHKRRISALGPGGLTRERAGFEVRDVHPTHYGRVCSIETPEGPNIGLINSLAIYARTNKYGFLETPYKKVVNGKVTDEIVYISAIEEGDYIIAQVTAKVDKNNILIESSIPCRYKGEFVFSSKNKINFIDISSKQIVSVAASLIPFLEHNDANRALMGSNMQRQAVPTFKSEKPLVGTGMERIVAVDSGTALVAEECGVIDFVDSSRIVLHTYKKNKVSKKKKWTGVKIYNLNKYLRSNQNTCISQKPIVKKGQNIKSGDILADSQATDLGELSLGKNVLVAFMSWNGYNFEDSILISEKLVKDEVFTSIHIEELICIARETKLGSEEITSDIPNVNESSLVNLDESGIVYVGAEVEEGDILVGKVSPKGETQLAPEEKLLRAIFGEKASDIKDTSLRVPNGMKGKVIDVQIFTREGVKKDPRAHQIEKLQIEKTRKNIEDEYRIFKKDIIFRINKIFKEYHSNKKENIDGNINNLLNIYKSIKIKDKEKNVEFNNLINKLKKLDSIKNKKFIKKKKKIIQGDELYPGIIKIIKVHLAVKKKIQHGDKISGRHGNKGVISAIVPEEDMPYMEDGTPIDIVLSPLGVPSRMNIGQILETHLGWVSKELGKKIGKILEKNEVNIKNIRNILDKIYNLNTSNPVNFDVMNNKEILELANNLKEGVPMATPVFDSGSEKQIKNLLKLANLPKNGQIKLFDGRTGKKFDKTITIGYMYILKLNHLVDEKMHARSTGSYSLVTQQPLGGRSQFGGQRFGEMEVWALEAYGAAYTLQEMLTVKSDDISGRSKIYKNIVKGDHSMDANIPESFNVLIKEIKSLGLRIELSSKKE